MLLRIICCLLSCSVVVSVLKVLMLVELFIVILCVLVFSSGVSLVVIWFGSVI